jgi:hypothetical protein
MGESRIRGLHFDELKSGEIGSNNWALGNRLSICLETEGNHRGKMCV